ncbi:hypothetical protein NL393_37365, partial [Klebsiella pneumoniae]|nr:hypothetical protein [Klebsiella pneumoniae]
GAEARLDAGPIAIEFRERDRPFVERLAAELPAWASEGWGEVGLLRFEPEEFTFATIYGPEQGRVVLNSPLVALREDGLDGETT